MSSLLLAQALVTAALAGLCWTVQVAVYPLFRRLLAAMPTEGFRAYHAAYTGAMGWVAAPLMLAELGLALAWLWSPFAAPLAPLGLALVAAVWILTFALIVPAHRRLQNHPDPAVIRRLVRLNGLRTALWFARVAVLAAGLSG